MYEAGVYFQPLFLHFLSHTHQIEFMQPQTHFFLQVMHYVDPVLGDTTEVHLSLSQPKSAYLGTYSLQFPQGIGAYREEPY